MSAYIMRSTDDSSIEVVRPDNSSFRLIEVTDELNALLARAESAEKMADHWENKAKVKLMIPSIDWQRVRINTAIAALEGMLACRGGGDAIERAKVATEYADALVAELKKEVAE